MLKCYERKFPNSNVIMPLKAVVYFADIDVDLKREGYEIVYLAANIEIYK